MQRESLLLQEGIYLIAHAYEENYQKYFHLKAQPTKNLSSIEHRASGCNTKTFEILLKVKLILISN